MLPSVFIVVSKVVVKPPEFVVDRLWVGMEVCAALNPLIIPWVGIDNGTVRSEVVYLDPMGCFSDSVEPDYHPTLVARERVFVRVVGCEQQRNEFAADAVDDCQPDSGYDIDGGIQDCDSDNCPDDEQPGRERVGGKWDGTRPDEDG